MSILILADEYIVRTLNCTSSERKCTTPLAFETKPNELMMENIDFFFFIIISMQRAILAATAAAAAYSEFGVFSFIFFFLSIVVVVGILTLFFSFNFIIINSPLCRRPPFVSPECARVYACLWCRPVGLVLSASA